MVEIYKFLSSSIHVWKAKLVSCRTHTNGWVRAGGLTFGPGINILWNCIGEGGACKGRLGKRLVMTESTGSLLVFSVGVGDTWLLCNLCW